MAYPADHGFSIRSTPVNDARRNRFQAMLGRETQGFRGLMFGLAASSMLWAMIGLVATPLIW